ncbi:MAG: RNase adapter RapZ [Nitrospiraceae bacterium]|nr:MAG: RNase adapter RapZ [Nitrospiraceae bacterium]
MPRKHRISIFIITGLSGAGKTLALHAFEDSGFFCVDNLPSSLIQKFVNLCAKTSEVSNIAIGVDIRERKFLSDFSDTISVLRQKQNIEILFLEAADEVLVRRFKETRRPHPLGTGDLKKSLRKEAKLLSSIRQEANTIIDTSHLTPHQLRKFITETYLEKAPREMTVDLMSFGYKYGTPKEADIMFDVRFLPNPYFIQELKPLSGTSAKVKRFVLSNEATRKFLAKLYPLLNHVIPLYKEEGRSYLTIGIGCTGGRHRSPAIVLEVEKALKKQKLKITVTHRDLHIAS